MQNKTKKFKRYSERFKEQVLAEFLATSCSLESIRKKYDLGSMTLRRWLSSKGIDWTISEIDLPLDSEMKKETKSIKPLQEELPEDIAALKRLLTEERIRRQAAELRAAVAEKVIEIAERDLKLEIRKKSEARQSPK